MVCGGIITTTRCGAGVHRHNKGILMTTTDAGLQKAISLVAILNLAYFGIEFAVALAIGSVSLFADSIDFLEDASVNLLILFALGWSMRSRAHVGMLLAAILLVPALATLWTAWDKFWMPVAPVPLLLTLTGLGALVVNMTCAFMLVRFRHVGGSLTKAAFLSARNDALANVAIVFAGLVTAFLWKSAWPDLMVGIAIAAMNADAARQVWRAARKEHSTVPEFIMFSKDIDQESYVDEGRKD
jgi:Co/Zn/Cd efflux system component